MSTVTSIIARADLARAQQIIKWIVYSLLLVNFVFYAQEDIVRAIHTLHDGSTLFKITSEFATTIDTLAWFLLLAMFELETYQLDDDQWKGWVSKTVRGVRIVCIIMIAHTLAAYAESVIDYGPERPFEGVTNLCELTGQDLSFVYNLEYTDITSETCQTLSDESAFFRLGKINPLVTTAEGLELEQDLALADLIELIAWLVILLAIEVIVRLQGKGVTGGTTRTALQGAKLVAYGVLFLLSVYWARLGHWLYTWDEFIWVAGFAAIEMNVHEWRDELLEKSP
ncbi:MAG: hypothetical protein AAFN78_01075 [Pseudomonadota bacterium]